MELFSQHFPCKFLHIQPIKIPRAHQEKVFIAIIQAEQVLLHFSRIIIYPEPFVGKSCPDFFRGKFGKAF